MITVRDIPDEVYREIKKEAQDENRSLNKQCLHILKKFAKQKQPTAEVLKEIEALHVRVGSINLNPDEVKAMIEEGRP